MNLEPFGAGYKDMGPAVDVLEAAILNRTLRHAAHPILTWCVSNGITTMDPAGARKFDKHRAIERIDGGRAGHGGGQPRAQPGRILRFQRADGA